METSPPSSSSHRHRSPSHSRSRNRSRSRSKSRSRSHSHARSPSHTRSRSSSTSSRSPPRSTLSLSPTKKTVSKFRYSFKQLLHLKQSPLVKKPNLLDPSIFQLANASRTLHATQPSSSSSILSHSNVNDPHALPSHPHFNSQSNKSHLEDTHSSTSVKKPLTKINTKIETDLQQRDRRSRVGREKLSSPYSDTTSPSSSMNSSVLNSAPSNREWRNLSSNRRWNDTRSSSPHSAENRYGSTRQFAYHSTESYRPSYHRSRESEYDRARSFSQFSSSSSSSSSSPMNGSNPKYTDESSFPSWIREDEIDDKNSETFADTPIQEFQFHEFQDDPIASFKAAMKANEEPSWSPSHLHTFTTETLESNVTEPAKEKEKGNEMGWEANEEAEEELGVKGTAKTSSNGKSFTMDSHSIDNKNQDIKDKEAETIETKSKLGGESTKLKFISKEGKDPAVSNLSLSHMEPKEVNVTSTSRFAGRLFAMESSMPSSSSSSSSSSSNSSHPNPTPSSIDSTQSGTGLLPASLEHASSSFNYLNPSSQPYPQEQRQQQQQQDQLYLSPSSQPQQVQRVDPSQAQHDLRQFLNSHWSKTQSSFSSSSSSASSTLSRPPSVTSTSQFYPSGANTANLPPTTTPTPPSSSSSMPTLTNATKPPTLSEDQVHFNFILNKLQTMNLPSTASSTSSAPPPPSQFLSNTNPTSSYALPSSSSFSYLSSTAPQQPPLNSPHYQHYQQVQQSYLSQFYTQQQLNLARNASYALQQQQQQQQQLQRKRPVPAFANVPTSVVRHYAQYHSIAPMTASSSSSSSSSSSVLPSSTSSSSLSTSFRPSGHPLSPPGVVPFPSSTPTALYHSHPPSQPYLHPSSSTLPSMTPSSSSLSLSNVTAHLPSSSSSSSLHSFMHSQQLPQQQQQQVRIHQQQIQMMLQQARSNPSHRDQL